MTGVVLHRLRDLTSREALVRVGLVVAGAGLLLVVGRLAAAQPSAAVVITAAVLAVGVTAVHPGLIPLAVLPILLVVLRVGGGGVDLSLSDFALAAATLPALFLARRPFSPGLRAVLWASAVYQFATLATVVNNPYAANAIEWAHTWLLVSGSLLVGWAVGANGRARTGVRLLLGTIAVLALITVVEGVVHFAQGDFQPVYPSFPYGMHKNFAGTVCALGTVIACARPSWVGLTRRAAYSLMGLTFLAVLFTQSRQAVLGAVAGVFLLVLRSDGERKRPKLLLLLFGPFVLFVTNLVQDQLQSDNRFNSVLQRLTWFQDSMTVWQTDPWFGVGLRWWYTDRFDFRFQPPNAEIEVLTSAGVLGVAAFVALMIMSVGVARRLDPTFGSLALAVLVSRLVQGQFDLFWAAVMGSLPFVVLGICLGAKAHADRSADATRPGDAVDTARRRPVTTS
ncbi:O-antigen ligase family protein [Terrabacter sp. AAH1]